MPHMAAGQILTAGQYNSDVHQGIQLLEEQVLATPTTSVTFSSIDQEFKNLQLVFSGGSTDPTNQMRAQFNGDTAGGQYQFMAYVLRGDSTFEAFQGSQSSMQLGTHTTTDLLNSTQVTIFGYSRTDRQKLVVGQFVNGVTSATLADIQFNLLHGFWQSTAAITTMDIFLLSGDEFVAGSIFQLFGIGQE